MPSILPVIMCGGAGTRMWPESRERRPKQFIPLVGERSSFQETAAMFAGDADFAPPMIITNRHYAELVASQLNEIGATAEIVLEPMRRDSGPAVAVAAEIAFRRDPNTIVVVMPADHHVVDRAQLIEIFRRGAAAARDGYIVTLGLKPTFPATTYGYVRPGTPIGEGLCELAEFVEKPDEATALAHMRSGFLWNSGNFIFPAALMKRELAEFEPEIERAATAAVAAARDVAGALALDEREFASATKKSIDYAVMERTRRAAVLAADIGWSDIGSWTAVRDLSARDASGNVLRGNGVILDSSNAMVRSQGAFAAVVGVDDVIVVATGDAVLVLGAQYAGKVKELVDLLQKDGKETLL